MSPLSWEKKPRQESRAALSLPRGCRARCLSQPRFVTALSLPLRCPLHPAFSFQHARSRVKIKGRQRGRNAISQEVSSLKFTRVSPRSGQLGRANRHYSSEASRCSASREHASPHPSALVQHPTQRLEISKGFTSLPSFC